MPDNFGSFYEKPFRPLDSMSEVEAKGELEQWRNLYSWLDDEVKYWLTKVGETFRVSLRNGTTFTGQVGAVEYDMKRR